MEVSRIASISTTASVNSYPRSPKALKAHQNNLTQTDPISFSGNSAPPALVLSAATFPPKSAELFLDRYFQIRIQTQKRTNTRCPKPQVQRQQCQNVPTKSCDVVGHEQCNNVPKQHCFNNPEEKCTSVPRQSCKSVPREQCRKVSCSQLWLPSLNPHSIFYLASSFSNLTTSTSFRSLVNSARLHSPPTASRTTKTKIHDVSDPSIYTATPSTSSIPQRLNKEKTKTATQLVGHGVQTVLACSVNISQTIYCLFIMQL